MNTIVPFSHPMYIMLKPAGSLCNLRCKYCYYLEKSKLYEDNKNHVITDALLEKFIKEYIEAQTTPQVLFTWHGGETLMRPISFYRRAQDLLARQAPIDRRAKALDTMVINRLREAEEIEEPSSELYNDWNNNYAHRGGNLPDVYKIDLRGFHMPTPSRVITSNFGRRWGRRHQGLDIKVYIGDTIRAAFSGKVRVVKYDANGYGKYVVIRHNNGLETIYGHLSKQIVSPNQTVRADRKSHV